MFRKGYKGFSPISHSRNVIHNLIFSHAEKKSGIEMKKIMYLDDDRSIEISFGKRTVTTRFHEASHPKIDTRYVIIVKELLTEDEIETAIENACYDFHVIWNGKTRRPHALFVIMIIIELSRIAQQKLYKLDAKIVFIDSKHQEKTIKMNSFLKGCYRYLNQVDAILDEEKKRGVKDLCEDVGRRRESEKKV